jgi:hypothetical protein
LNAFGNSVVAVVTIVDESVDLAVGVVEGEFDVHFRALFFDYNQKILHFFASVWMSLSMLTISAHSDLFAAVAFVVGRDDDDDFADFDFDLGVEGWGSEAYRMFVADSSFGHFDESFHSVMSHESVV